MNCDETLLVCEHGKPRTYGCNKCYPPFDFYKNLEKLHQQFISQKLQLDILHQYKVRQIDENRKISKRVDELQNDHAKIINECVDRLYDIDKCKEGIQKQLDDIIGIIVKGDSVLENDVIRIERKIEKIENMPKFDLKECIDLVNEHEKYLKNIDKIALCDPDKIAHNQKVLSEKFDRLEQLFYDEKDKFRNTEKKPYKCPCCNGKCGFKNDSLLLGQKLNYLQWQDVNGVFDKCKCCEGKGIVWS